MPEMRGDPRARRSSGARPRPRNPPRYQLSDGRDDMLHGGVATSARRLATPPTSWAARAASRQVPGRSSACPTGRAGRTSTSPSCAGSAGTSSTSTSPTGGGTHAMWCGRRPSPTPAPTATATTGTRTSCSTRSCPNPAVTTTVRLQCIYNNYSEAGYDYFRIQQNQGGTWPNLRHIAGANPTGTFDQTITFAPSDYVGPACEPGPAALQGFSDGACPTRTACLNTTGLAQVDNIRVTIGHNSVVQHFDRTTKTAPATTGRRSATPRRRFRQDLERSAGHRSLRLERDPAGGVHRRRRRGARAPAARRASPGATAPAATS